MKIFGLKFSENTIDDIQRTVDADPTVSRRSLSQRLCKLFDWRGVTGHLKEMNCRKALSRLHLRKLISLPEPVSVPAFQTRTVHKPFIRPVVVCTLAELGSINLIHRNWRKLLGGGCQKPAFSGDWAEREWGSAPLGDARLVQRLITIGRDRYAHPQASIPQTCGGNRAKTKAAYRFFDNESATLKNLIAPHIEATIRRIGDEKIVLAIQDTTTLNYTTLKETENLGSIGSSLTGATGLILHGTLAVNTEGTPLGLIDAQCWARKPEEYGKKAKRHSLPIEEKESYKWIKSFQAATAILFPLKNRQL